MTVIQFFKFRQPLDEIEEIFEVEESNDGSNIWAVEVRPMPVHDLLCYERYAHKSLDIGIDPYLKISLVGIQ